MKTKSATLRILNKLKPQKAAGRSEKEPHDYVTRKTCIDAHFLCSNWYHVLSHAVNRDYVTATTPESVNVRDVNVYRQFRCSKVLVNFITTITTTLYFNDYYTFVYCFCTLFH